MYSNSEEEKAAQAVVTSIATDGFGGFDTYRVALKLVAQDVLNLGLIYGAKDHPMEFPAAEQIDDGGVDVGGVDPKAFAATPNAKWGTHHTMATMRLGEWL
jgi:hypothetical protein